MHHHLQPNAAARIPQHKPAGIRDQLERAAWHHHPEFAATFTQRRTGRNRLQRSRIPWARVLTSLLLGLLLPGQLPAQGEPEWGLTWNGPASGHSLAINTEIAAELIGLLAEVEVSQVFSNDSLDWREAIYRFPLPQGAAVDRLQIQAGQRFIEGEIRERETARRQYQQARSQGKLAALLEQQRPNQFETRIANIGPGEEIRIRIRFLVQLDYADGEFRFGLPLTFSPRWNAPLPETTAGKLDSADPRLAAADAATNDVDRAPEPRLVGPHTRSDQQLRLQVRLHSALPLERLESRYHDMDIQPFDGGYLLHLRDSQNRPDRRFELVWTPQLTRQPQAALSTWDDGQDIYALLLLAPPLPEATLPQAREVVFVIDTSGSMEGLALQQAKMALFEGLGWLQADDRYNIIEFNSDAHLLYPRSVPPDAAYLEETVDYIDALQANGGTNMAPALQQALQLPAQSTLLRQIVFITDGSVDNEPQLLRQIGQELADSRLFTVSIGSAPNSGFMRQAAEIGRGSHTHIGKLEEVAERINALWRRIESPALQMISVDWGMDAEIYPQLVPDLYAGEPLWLLARLPQMPYELEISGDLNGQEWNHWLQPTIGTGSESIATLWARSRIGALEDAQLFGAIDAAEARQEIVDLALAFGLLTRYTSLVAVDKTPLRPVAAGLQTEEVPGLLPHGSSNQVASFSATASGWRLQVLAGLLMISFSASLLWFGTSTHRPLPARPSLPAAAGSPVTADGSLRSAPGRYA